MSVFFIPNIRLELLDTFTYNMEKYSPNNMLSGEEYVRRVLKMFLDTLKDDYVYNKEIVSFDPALLTLIEDKQFDGMIMLQVDVALLSLVDCIGLQEAYKGRLVTEDTMITHLCRRMMVDRLGWVA